MNLKNIPYILALQLDKIKLVIRPSGQMSLKNEVGRMIYAICSLSENTTIVEIGTWNGLGSSTVIARGVLAGKSNTKVFGLEIDEKRFKESKKNLKKYEFFEVLHGRIVEIGDLDLDSLEGHEKEWVESDSHNMSTAPNVLKMLPDRIDVLLLDGGEFSSYAEYQSLKDREVKWLILDDVNVRKNRRVLEEAVSSGYFLQVWKSDERNGTAILIGKTRISC